jgi:hypothetical protein
MSCPADLYTPSPRPYAGLPDISYPFHDRDVLYFATIPGLGPPVPR